MARYAAQVESAAALASATGFGWLMSSANNGYKLRRCSLGVRAGTGVPTSMQVVVGINRVTSAGTTPAAGMTPAKLDPNTAAAGAVWNTGYATPPTTTANDQYRIAFNSQSTVDLPWELLEEFVVASGTTNGLAFINQDNALPASHQLVISIEWEE